ncbi:MAG: GNAT family N-acetyltransferase [Pseudomonadota bacterium]
MLQSRSEVSIRKARVGDAKLLADIFAASWRNAYQGIIPHLHLETMISQRAAGWWRRALRRSGGTFVLKVGDTIVGYCTCGLSRSKGEYQGEIYELYIDPDHQGLGYGEHLFEAARQYLDQRQLRGLVIWAILENDKACAFYWNRGGRPVAEAVDTIGGRELEKVAFAWH